MSVFPPASSDHGVIQASLEAFAIAARASATFLSTLSTRWLVDVSCGVSNAGLPVGAMSRFSVANVMVAQVGRFAKWADRCPRSMDLTCGFQVALPSGTLS